MAIDILSISPILDEPERVFLGARRTVLWDRARLKGNTIERLQYIKHQKKNRIIIEVLATSGDNIIAASDVDIEDDEAIEVEEEDKI